MPDDERVRIIDERLGSGLIDLDAVRYLLERLAEAERRGMERAAVLLDEKMQSILADARNEKEYEMPAMAHCFHLKEVADTIRAEAAKHED